MRKAVGAWLKGSFRLEAPRPAADCNAPEPGRLPAPSSWTEGDGGDGGGGDGGGDGEGRRFSLMEFTAAAFADAAPAASDPGGAAQERICSPFEA